MSCSSLNTAVSYLGVKVTMNLDWHESMNKLTMLTYMFTSRIACSKLSLTQAVQVINMYLIPKLDTLLRHINVTSTAIEKLDTMIARCLIQLCRMSRAVRPAALASLTGVMLPSHYEIIAKVSECFIRMNSCFLSSRIGRLRWMEASSSSSAHAINNRMVRVIHLAQCAGLSLLNSSSRPLWSQHDLVPSGPFKVKSMSSRWHASLDAV